MGDKRPKSTAKLRAQKKAAAAVVPRGGKTPVVSPVGLGDDVMQQPLRFRFNRVDVGGPWCLSLIETSHHRDLIRFMANCEAMTVGEVFNGRIGKDEDVASASPNMAARSRAQTIYGTDAERIASLRLRGAARLWGLRYRNEFSVIWWDPRHEVWPTSAVTDN